MADQLKKMNWKGEPFCKLCGAREDVDHLMFRCASSRFLWCCIRDILDWRNTPSSGVDLMAAIQKARDRRALLFMCAACTWVIWLVRNDWVFNNKLIKDVLQLPHKVVFFMMQWKRLAPQKLGGELESLLASLLARIRTVGEQGSTASTGLLEGRDST